MDNSLSTWLQLREPADAAARSESLTRTIVDALAHRETVQVLDLATVGGAGVLGRDAELERLNGWLERALRGERQLVFVTGEPGIGKTTLVSAVRDQAAARGIWMAWGQCLEHYGAGEAYLPVLDGLSRLGRTAGTERITELLRRHAPTWLLELPSLIPTIEREALRQQVIGASRSHAA